MWTKWTQSRSDCSLTKGKKKVSNYKRTNSYDLFLDYVLEQQDKILELSCELENAEELILDNYLETLDENIPDEMHQRFKDAHYKLQSAKRQFEYIEILERHLSQ